MVAAVHFSHLSNAWYPAKGRQFRRKIEHIQELAHQNFSVHTDPHQIRAILVPHASYDYSGVVAASAYQALEHSNVKRIFIIGPSHYVSFQGVALPDLKYEKFGNEVGSLRLDRKILKKLRMDDSNLFKTVQKAYDLEHSIEIQIPLIQNYCPSCSIIPLLLGDLNYQQLDQLANILRSFIDNETICIFTSDLTHFGKNFSYIPFTDDIPQNLVALDQSIVASIERLHRAQFEEILERTKATVCGSIPIKLLLTLFQNSDLRAYVACYDRSTHEKNPNHSVSYVSMIFSSEQKTDLPWNHQLIGYEKMVLKKLVQETLQNLFHNKKSCACDYILTQTLHDHLGIFVTLYDKDHQLRGCIGKIISDQPLYKTVCEMTRAAALEDSRFRPVKQEEIPALTFEISVLCYPQEIDSYENIQLGTDGIILKYKNKSALFLPEVALEQGWSLEKTLQELSRKAGLEAGAYKKKDATFEIFQTIKIVSGDPSFKDY
jgi:hypothetical protein